MRTLSIRRPDDFHVHLRNGEMLGRVAEHTARHFARALVMPNTDPPIRTWQEASQYRRAIEQLIDGSGFQPLMTYKIEPTTTANDVAKLAQSRTVIAGKLYPDGVTTGSENGVRDFEALFPVFETMEHYQLVLCLHGEHPDAFCLDREVAFLPVLAQIALTFPKLRIVLEHVTTEKALVAVEALPDTVAATITVHHLSLTLDDVIGGLLRPHHFCKPVAKYPSDRAALVRAVLSGNPRYFLGTDSAPHDQHKKECAAGCAGVYTAPVAMSLLAELFAQHGALDRLEPFVAEFGARFYGLPLNQETLELVERPMTVPATYAGIIPFRANETIAWSVA